MIENEINNKEEEAKKFEVCPFCGKAAANDFNPKSECDDCFEKKKDDMGKTDMFGFDEDDSFWRI